ncbi:hypothetical protein ACHAXM_005192 [Skeletonema potamos]
MNYDRILAGCQHLSTALMVAACVRLSDATNPEHEKRKNSCYRYSYVLGLSGPDFVLTQTDQAFTY